MTRRALVRLALALAVLACAGIVALVTYAHLPLPPLGGRVDAIRVEKSKHRLVLLRAGQRLRTYRVALGAEPLGRKERQGDNRTPEGRYTIDFHQPDSQFHLALHISYPSDADRKRAKRLGVSPGGDIMIHGLPDQSRWLGRFHRARDWTEGCIAVTNEEIEEIYTVVEDGTPIEIVP